jgi:co-chaperonin GroES (HSP10)
MKPTGNKVLVRRENTYASQKSSIIMTVEAEYKWTVESIGGEVEDLKKGDRVVLGKLGIKELDTNLFLTSADNILAKYEDS